MQIATDENGYVTGYATLGGIGGGVEYTGEAPEDFGENHSYYRLMDGELILDATKMAAAEQRAAAAAETADILAWFAAYDLQTAQYQRCVRMGQAYDGDIAVLDTEAAEKQLRIRALRGLIAQGGEE